MKTWMLINQRSFRLLQRSSRRWLPGGVVPPTE
jgi:hypothetical protein